MFVSRALDDTKKMRKAGADIFAKSELEKNGKILKTNYEIGQISISGALDDTKTIGKAGGDIFPNSGAEKH